MNPKSPNKEEKPDVEKKDTPPKEEKPQIPPPVAPTPEQLAAESEQFLEAQFGIPATKKEKPEEPPKEDAPKEEPAPEPDKDEPKEPEAERKPKKRFTPKPSTEEVEAIARRVVQEERPEPEPAPHKQPESTQHDDDLSEDDRDYLGILEELERNNPAHKGIVDRQKKFLRRAKDYKDKYEKENGAGTFNPDDAEHTDFYRRNQPAVPQREIKAAERGMIERSAAERAKAELRKELEPRLSQIDAEKAQKEAEPVIAESVLDAVEEVFKAAPEFKALFEPKNLTDEAVKKMAEVNPVVHHYASEEAELVMGVVGELERLSRLGKYHKFDQAKKQTLSTGRAIYPHAMINEAWSGLEQKVASAPPEQRMDGNRKFITGGEFTARLNEIRESNLPEQEKRRRAKQLEDSTWMVTAAHVRNFVISQSANRVKATAQKFVGYSKTLEKQVPTKNGKPQSDQPAKPSAKSGLSKGTSTATESDTADNSSALGGGGEDSSKEFLRAHAGG